LVETSSVRQAFCALQEAIDAINVAAAFSLRLHRLEAGATKIPSPLEGKRVKYLKNQDDKYTMGLAIFNPRGLFPDL
jgi:hypothetical protein